MKRICPDKLNCCKLCTKPFTISPYMERGLCKICFKRVKCNGNLNNYCKYSEDNLRMSYGRQSASKELADLVYCIRNVGVGEVADCLGVSRHAVNKWLRGSVPVNYKDKLRVMRRAVKEETYEFRYPEIELDPWQKKGDYFHGTTF